MLSPSKVKGNGFVGQWEQEWMVYVKERLEADQKSPEAGKVVLRKSARRYSWWH